MGQNFMILFRHGDEDPLRAVPEQPQQIRAQAKRDHFLDQHAGQIFGNVKDYRPLPRPQELSISVEIRRRGLRVPVPLNFPPDDAQNL